MADITITLKPPRDGVRELVVDPTSYYAESGEDVHWELRGEDAAFFTLIFPRGSPFEDDEVHSDSKMQAQKRVNAAAPKRFHYYVAVADSDAENPDIFLIAGCPEIIIR